MISCEIVERNDSLETCEQLLKNLRQYTDVLNEHGVSGCPGYELF